MQRLDFRQVSSQARLALAAKLDTLMAKQAWAEAHRLIESWLVTDKVLPARLVDGPRRRDVVDIRHAVIYFRALLANECGPDHQALCAACLDQVPVEIGCDDYLLQYDDFLDKCRVLEQARAGVQYRPPPVLIIAQPQSASSFVSALLSQILWVPIIRVDFGGTIVPRWLRTLRDGGAITHGHPIASRFNAETLNREWPGPITLQVRDPRQAGWSAMLKDATQPEREALVAAARLPDACVERLIYYVGRSANWLDGWLASRDLGTLPRLSVVDYELVSAEPQTAISDILRRTGNVKTANEPRLCIDAAQRDLSLYNFRLGQREDWARRLSTDMVARVTAVLPERVRTYLEE